MDGVTFGKLFSAGVAKDGEPYKEARDAVVKAGGAVVPQLEKEASTASDWQTRVTAWAWLARIRAGALCQAVEERMRGNFGEPLGPKPLTGNWSASARGMAIVELGKETTPCILEILLKTRDADDKAQEALIFALAQLRDRRATESLMALIEQTAQPQVKRQAIGALGRIGDEAAIPFLLKLLDNTSLSADERGAAALSLGQLHAKEAVHPLLELFLNTENSLVLRGQALLGLGGIGDRSVSGAIAGRLEKEQSAELLQQMLTALSSVGDRQALPAVSAIAEKYPALTIREQARETRDVISHRP